MKISISETNISLANENQAEIYQLKAIDETLKTSDLVYVSGFSRDIQHNFSITFCVKGKE